MKKIRNICLFICVLTCTMSRNFASDINIQQTINTDKSGLLLMNKKSLIDNYGNKSIMNDQEVYNEMNRRVNEFTKQNYNFSSEITFAVDKKLLAKSTDHTDLKCVIEWEDGEKVDNKPNLTSSAFKLSMASNQPIMNYLIKQAYNPEVVNLENQIQEYASLRNISLFPEDIRDMYLLSGPVEFIISLSPAESAENENYFINILKNHTENDLPINELREKFNELANILGIKVYSDTNTFAISREIEQLVRYNVEAIPFGQLQVMVITTDWRIDDYKSIWGGPNI